MLCKTMGRRRGSSEGVEPRAAGERCQFPLVTSQKVFKHTLSEKSIKWGEDFFSLFSGEFNDLQKPRAELSPGTRANSV